MDGVRASSSSSSPAGGGGGGLVWFDRWWVNSVARAERKAGKGRCRSGRGGKEERLACEKRSSTSAKAILQPLLQLQLMMAMLDSVFS
jgi:hypothetical protein